MDHSLIEKYTWESIEIRWDHFLRPNVLSLAILFRFSNKVYDIIEFGTKDCLMIFSLEWKLMMSHCQDEAIYTHTHPHTRDFIGEICYGGRLRTNTRAFESTAIETNFNVIKSHL